MSRNADPQNPREAEVIGQVVFVQSGIRRQNRVLGGGSYPGGSDLNDLLIKPLTQGATMSSSSDGARELCISVSRVSAYSQKALG